MDYINILQSKNTLFIHNEVISSFSIVYEEMGMRVFSLIFLFFLKTITVIVFVGQLSLLCRLHSSTFSTGPQWFGGTGSYVGTSVGFRTVPKLRSRWHRSRNTSVKVTSPKRESLPLGRPFFQKKGFRDQFWQNLFGVLYIKSHCLFFYLSEVTLPSDFPSRSLPTTGLCLDPDRVWMFSIEETFPGGVTQIGMATHIIFITLDRNWLLMITFVTRFVRWLMYKRK